MRATEPFDDFAPWKDSLELNKQVYALSGIFPEEEKNGLVAKMRNCTIEIAVCISRFISVRNPEKHESEVYKASDKLYELEALFRIALSLNYINQKDLDNILSLTELIKQHYVYLMRRIEREKEEN
jgi:four helix bundle protein